MGEGLVDRDGVTVIEGLTDDDGVTAIEGLTDDDGVRVAVKEGVKLGGSGVALTDAVSLPTAISTPQTSGRVSVAEYTHVGFSFTPLIWSVGPQARNRRKVRLHVCDTGASGPYSI